MDDLKDLLDSTLKKVSETELLRNNNIKNNNQGLMYLLKKLRQLPIDKYFNKDFNKSKNKIETDGILLFIEDIANLEKIFYFLTKDNINRIHQNYNNTSSCEEQKSDIIDSAFITMFLDMEDSSSYANLRLTIQTQLTEFDQIIKNEMRIETEKEVALKQGSLPILSEQYNKETNAKKIFEDVLLDLLSEDNNKKNNEFYACGVLVTNLAIIKYFLEHTEMQKPDDENKILEIICSLVIKFIDDMVLLKSDDKTNSVIIDYLVEIINHFEIKVQTFSDYFRTTKKFSNRYMDFVDKVKIVNKLTDAISEDQQKRKK